MLILFMLQNKLFLNTHVQCRTWRSWSQMSKSYVLKLFIKIFFSILLESRNAILRTIFKWQFPLTIGVGIWLLPLPHARNIFWKQYNILSTTSSFNMRRTIWVNVCDPSYLCVYRETHKLNYINKRKNWQKHV